MSKVQPTIDFPVRKTRGQRSCKTVSAARDKQIVTTTEIRSQKASAKSRSVIKANEEKNNNFVLVSDEATVDNHTVEKEVDKKKNIDGSEKLNVSDPARATKGGDLPEGRRQRQVLRKYVDSNSKENSQLKRTSITGMHTFKVFIL